MTDKAGYPQAAFGGDTIRTVTLTPQEQALPDRIWVYKAAGYGGGGDVMMAEAVSHWDSGEPIGTEYHRAPAPAQAWEPPEDREEGYRCLVVVEMEWQRRFDGSLGWAVPDEHWGRCIESYARSFAPLPAALIPDTEGR